MLGPVTATRLGRKRQLVLLVCVCALSPACQQEMARQPSYRPDERSPFFRDGRADRPIPSGTVARGHLHADLPLFTCKRASSDQQKSEASTTDKAKATDQAATGDRSSAKQLLA